MRPAVAEDGNAAPARWGDAPVCSATRVPASARAAAAVAAAVMRMRLVRPGPVLRFRPFGRRVGPAGRTLRTVGVGSSGSSRVVRVVRRPGLPGWPQRRLGLRPCSRGADGVVGAVEAGRAPGGPLRHLGPAARTSQHCRQARTRPHQSRDARRLPVSPSPGTATGTRSRWTPYFLQAYRRMRDKPSPTGRVAKDGGAGALARGGRESRGVARGRAGRPASGSEIVPASRQRLGCPRRVARNQPGVGRKCPRFAGGT